MQIKRLSRISYIDIQGLLLMLEYQGAFGVVEILRRDILEVLGDLFTKFQRRLLQSSLTTLDKLFDRLRKQKTIQRPGAVLVSIWYLPISIAALLHMPI
jgi:hypothetical protein